MLTPTVAVLIIKDDQVLLVKHGLAAKHIDDKVGLPSGHIEEGETETGAAIRELKEETGLDAAENDLVEFPNNYYVARIPLKDGSNKEYGWRVFFCNKYSGGLKGSDETTPFWHRISDINTLSLLPNVSAAIQNGLNFINT